MTTTAENPKPDFAKVHLDELPDKFAKSEAHAQCQCLAHAWFLRESYRTITQDRKAFSDWDRTCEAAMKGIRRIFPTNEAEWLIQFALQTGGKSATEAKVINDREALEAQHALSDTNAD